MHKKIIEKPSYYKLTIELKHMKHVNELLNFLQKKNLSSDSLILKTDEKNSELTLTIGFLFIEEARQWFKTFQKVYVDDYGKSLNDLMHNSLKLEERIHLGWNNGWAEITPELFYKKKICS